MKKFSRDLVEKPPPQGGGVGLLDAGSPQAVVQRGVEVANQLSDIIRRQKLCTTVRGRRYVLAEGWTTLGAMIGILPREVSVIEDDVGNFVATVELVRLSDLGIVGRASAMVGVDEPVWKSRPKFQRRSMAVTRAVGKAYRLSLAWIVRLAGYDVTPAEEVSDTDPQPSSAEIVEVVTTPVDTTTPVDAAKSTAGVVVGMSGGTPDDAHEVMATTSPSTNDQHDKIKQIVKRLGMSAAAAKEMLETHGGRRLADLTIQQADELIASLETAITENECPF